MFVICFQRDWEGGGELCEAETWDRTIQEPSTTKPQTFVKNTPLEIMVF